MKKILTVKHVNNIISRFFPLSFHQKRIESITNAVFGILFSDRLMSSAIGRSLAAESGRTPKHCIKQVDRLLGNKKWDIPTTFRFWIPKIVGLRKNIVLTIDWTEFCYTGHYCLSINLVTKHGRATPLIWKTVDDRYLKNNRTNLEINLLRKLKAIIGSKTNVTVLADRGFCSTKLFDFIEKKLNWGYVIRLKKNHYVEIAPGYSEKVSEFVPKNGRAVVLENVKLMKSKRYDMACIVLIKKAKAKEAWILASNIRKPKQEILDLYSKRFTCEENFRDIKDDKFGVGFKETIISSVERMDRMLILNAFASFIHTLLGEIGERLNYSKKLKANTSLKRTHSLYRQGREYMKGVQVQYVTLFRQHLFKLLGKIDVTKTIYAIL